MDLKQKYHLSGSFLQPWLPASWSDERWRDELSMMKSCGMEYLIFSPVSTRKRDGSGYIIYPSNLEEFKDFEKNNLLEKCLYHCKQERIKLILDTFFDEKWWDYGWIWRKSGELCKKGFMAFMKKSSELSNKICDEILSLYGNNYNDTVFAWYYTPEIWNVTVLDKNIYFQIIGEGVNIILEHLNKVSPGVPFIISPFVNSNLLGSSPKKLYNQWKELISLINFRDGDIICPQDSVGTGGMPIGDGGVKLENWTIAYYNAVKTANVKLRLWSNNETFTKDFKSCSMERFIRQMQITGPYSEKNVAFSYSHYFSPYLADPSYHKEYIKYLESR